MARFVVLLVALIVIAVPFSLAFAGCGTTDVWLFDCKNPDHGHLGPDGGPDPCHYDDVDASPDVDASLDVGEECAVGKCTKRPSGWDGPLWVWIGPNPVLIGSEGVPDCPPGDSDREGYADLDAPDECGPCTCEPSSGSCELPSVLTASSSTCATDGPGSLHFPFNAPAFWDGTCDTTTQVPAGVASSLTIAPLTVAQESCAVTIGQEPPAAARVVTPYWKTFARTCVGHDWAECGGPQWYCIDKSQAPFPGARLCVLNLGDSFDTCDEEWPERHLIYQEDIDDERQCTECTCGPPMGSMCTALLSVYENSAACSGPVVFNQLPISSVSPGPCFDLSPPGKPMGSKLATPPTYIPGTCEAIPGSFIPDGGSLTVTPSFTLCCKP